MTPFTLKIGNQIPVDFANQFYDGRKQSAA